MDDVTHCARWMNQVVDCFESCYDHKVPAKLEGKVYCTARRLHVIRQSVGY